MSDTHLSSDFENLLQTLTDEVDLEILTNGVGDIQRAKLARYDLDHFFDVFLISGELETMNLKTRDFNEQGRDWTLITTSMWPTSSHSISSRPRQPD